jgi:ABC-type glycerol-3-phosphate transport system substrate-binding protein
MIKKGFIFGLLIVLVFSLLAACSSGGDSEQSSSNSEESSSEESNTSSETPAEPVEISILFAESLLAGIHADLAKEYEAANPNVKVNVETLPDGGYFDTVRTRISTGEVPDLIQINAGHDTTDLLDEAGYIYDLKDMDSMQNFFPAIVEGVKNNGKVACFSLGVGVLGLPYDKKALADVGYPEAPKTWEELMDAGQKLKANGKDLLVYAAKWESSAANVFHWAFGNKMVTDPEFKTAILAGTVDWSKPEYNQVLVDGFTKFKELNQYVRAGSFTNEYAVAQQSLASGEAAMVIGGTWEAGTYRGLNKDLDLGFANLPYAPAEQNPYIFVPEDGIAVNAKSANLEAAKAFANWLFSKETYAKINKAKGNFSSVDGVGDLDPSYSDVPNWLKTDRVVSFMNVGVIKSSAWTELGQAAQQYTFDNKLDAAVKRFVDAYNAK